MSFSLTARAARAPSPTTSVRADPGAERRAGGSARGRDLLVSSQTGSGKTIAYGLAIGETLLGSAERSAARAPLALIIAPTRELRCRSSASSPWLMRRRAPA